MNQAHMDALYTGSLRIKISYFYPEKSNTFYKWCETKVAHCIPFTLKILISYHLNLNFLSRHLKQGIKQFHEKFVLAPADKASNNYIVV